MKKIVLIVLMVFSALTAGAQLRIDPRFFNNQFLALGGGLTLYDNETSLTTGYNAEVSIGNWVLNDMALRVSFGTASAKNALDLTSSFYYGHCTFMWDALSTLTGARNANRVVAIYPMFGFGFLYRPDIPVAGKVDNVYGGMLNEDSTAYRFDVDFMAVFGVHAEFRIPTPVMSTWPLFVEAKLFLLPQDYDFNHKMAGLYNFTFGIKKDLKYDPHHKSIPGESRGWGYDWFVGLGAGPNFSAMNMESPEVKLGDRVGMNADITFGRTFSSFWTVRFGVSVMKGTTEHTVRAGFDAEPYEYTFFNARADLMFNVANLVGSYKGRRFGLFPYAGAGIIKRFDQEIYVMEADAGLMARWSLNKSVDLYADGRYIMVPPRFNEGHEMMGNGYPLLNIGVIYNFEPRSNR